MFDPIKAPFMQTKAIAASMLKKRQLTKAANNVVALALPALWGLPGVCIPPKLRALDTFDYAKGHANSSL